MNGFGSRLSGSVATHLDPLLDEAVIDAAVAGDATVRGVIEALPSDACDNCGGLTVQLAGWRWVHANSTEAALCSERENVRCMIRLHPADCECGGGLPCGMPGHPRHCICGGVR